MDAFVEKYMQKDVQDSVENPTLHKHPKQRCYDSRLFLERLIGSSIQGRSTILRRPRNVILVPPNPLFESFQPLIQTRTTFGTCCNTNYDHADQGELRGVIEINVRDECTKIGNAE